MIHTSRLTLRPLRIADLEDLHALWTDERVRKYIWDGKAIPIEQTREIIEKSEKLFDESGLGLWAIREHGRDELVGFTGYWHFRDPPELELLFGLAPEHWGREYAKEAARSMIEYGFEVLGFEKIVASTDAPNKASVRVLDKLGMQPFERPDEPDTRFYALTKNEWDMARCDT